MEKSGPERNTEGAAAMTTATRQATGRTRKHLARLTALLLSLLLAPVLSTAADTPAPPTVLITGASRGIGLEFARQYAEKGWRVIATARDPAASEALSALAKSDPDVILETLDVTDHAGVDALAERYQGQAIDLLLLNAAMGPRGAGAMAPLAKLEWEEARQSFEVNSIGPMKVAQAFMDHVARSERKLVVAMSSDSGSLAASVDRPVLYHYRASKAALNMYFHTLAYEAPRRGITVVMMHPGIVATSPVMARFPGAQPPADSVRRMMAVFDGLTAADNGRFLDYRGETMPW
jgi:NAD(P)-dependent dehydrogenase (short-subunit alcohol dehydrogenase family)